MEKLNKICVYIDSALKEFHNINSMKFFLFCELDCIEYIANNSRLKFLNYEIIANNDDKAAIYDLHLLSCCKNHIITNSTFGWWGAWLCSNLSQQVICPKKRNADQEGEGVWGFKNQIPNNWIQIPY